MAKKYKLKYAGVKRTHREDAFTLKTYYRLVALRDIPEHNVKAGDLGGLVTSKVKLSHEGSCWIADEAMVGGNVVITDDVYISGSATALAFGGNAKVILKDNVRISEEATVRQVAWRLFDYKEEVTISGNAQIFGKTLLINNKEISGNTKIHGSAQVYHGSSVLDDVEICDHAFVGAASKISGSSKISQTAAINASKVHDTNVSGTMLTNQRVNNGNFPSAGVQGAKALDPVEPKKAIAAPEKEESTKGLFSFVDNAITAKHIISAKRQESQDSKLMTEKTLESYNGILQELASYETDIVKIIKYPVMTDRTDRHTRAMILAVNKAKRYMDNPESKHFKDAVLELESSFITAESNARKIASTMLSQEEKKRLDKAKDLFSVASNESSSEQEKKVAFKQGFKQLEGIIDVPEIAIDTFRVRIGLPALEA